MDYTFLSHGEIIVMEQEREGESEKRKQEEILFSSR